MRRFLERYLGFPSEAPIDQAPAKIGPPAIIEGADLPLKNYSCVFSKAVAAMAPYVTGVTDWPEKPIQDGRAG